MEKIVVLGNGSDWCDISLTDLHHQENCLILNDDLPCSTKSILGRLAWIHYSRKINKIIKLPLKNMWFPYFAKYIAAKCDDKLYIIIYDRHRLANNEAFLVYIKKRYTNVKLIYVFTNIVSISGAKENKFIEKLNDYYDVVYAFDPSDVPRYQFKYSPLIYSRYDVCKEKNDGSIFYVGRAKDRYGFLMDVYAKLVKMHVDRKFFIFGVDPSEQKFQHEITYNTLIPYKTVLEYIQQSGCLLDIIQGESEGFTIKVCEAIFYNKKLITTNKNIKNMDFYDKRYIRVIESADDIDETFLNTNLEVQYSESGRTYFSAESFLDRMKNDVG